MAQIPAKMDADAYYEEVTVVRKSHEVGTYFLVKVPKYDKNGDPIKIKRGFAEDKTQGYLETPRSFAKRKSATLVTNASTYSSNTNRTVGLGIYNGEIVQELKRDVWNYILAIKEDGTMKSFEPSTTAAEILAQGYTNALTSFIPLVEGGKMVSSSVFATREMYQERHPRQAIAQDAEGNTYILTTEGRRLDEKGWTAKECAQVFLDLGMTFGFMLDGGGSAQTVYNSMLVNRITDDGGREERDMVDFLYVGKDMETTMNASEALNPTGDVMKIVNDQIAEIEDDIEALRVGAGKSSHVLMSKYFNSTASDYGTVGHGIPRFWQMPGQMVYMLGTVKLTKLGTFMTLPESLKPSITLEFLTVGYGSNDNLYKVKVGTSGDVSVSLVSGSGSTHNVSLNGIMYPNY